VELTLAPDHCFSLADFQQRVSDIRRTVESHVPELDVAIFIESEVA
jgi:hypothetical protein